jgi:ATP-dependent Clp protease ATP-binding subunit ClpC
VLSEQASESGQETEAVTDEISEQGVYASNASIASIERGLQSRELDKTLLAVYPFTLEARRVLEEVRLQAQGLAQVGPEHLLLGLLREEKGIIADLLGDLGTSVETVRTKIRESLSTQNH